MAVSKIGMAQGVAKRADIGPTSFSSALSAGWPALVFSHLKRGLFSSLISRLMQAFSPVLRSAFSGIDLPAAIKDTEVALRNPVCVHDETQHRVIQHAV